MTDRLAMYNANTLKLGLFGATLRFIQVFILNQQHLVLFVIVMVHNALIFF